MNANAIRSIRSTCGEGIAEELQRQLEKERAAGKPTGIETLARVLIHNLPANTEENSSEQPPPAQPSPLGLL